MTASAVKEKVHTAPIQDAINETQPRALAVVEPSAPSAVAPAAPSTEMPFTFTPAQIEIIKHMYMPGATDDELAVFVYVCTTRQLNPFIGQIQAVKRRQKRDGKWVDTWTFMTRIDGFRLIAERTKKYRGQTVPLYCGPDGRWTETWLETAPPAAAKVGVLREDFDAPIYGVALWREYVQTFEDGNPMAMWAKMPSIMLAKVAEALAIRKAFPEETSGLYTDDEMAQANNAERAESRRAGQTQAGDHAAGSGASAPARPADAFAGVDPEQLTLEQAMALPLLGRADKWNGNGGRPLRDVPEKVLRGVHRWMGEGLDQDAKLAVDADGKMDDAGIRKFHVTRAAIALVLAEIEKDQGQLNLNPAVEAPSATVPPGTLSKLAATESGTSTRSLPTHEDGATQVGLSQRSEADDSAFPVEKSIDELHAELRELMDHPLMPTPAREYFASRVTNGQIKTVTAAKLTIALARLAYQIGDELVTCLEPRQAKEILGLLKHSSTYKPDVLTRIRDNLRVSTPGSGGKSTS